MKNRNPNLPKQTELSDPDLVHTHIALRAYQLYKARGFLNGFDLQDWLQAERETLEQPEAFFLLLRSDPCLAL